MLPNRSRLEWRDISYSTDDTDRTLRFRNRTDAALSLFKPKFSTSPNLILFAYFEAFKNFAEVGERFFTHSKTKIGFLYRLGTKFQCDLGVIYQDATNNATEPTQIPTNIMTNYVVDWGVSFVLDSKTD